VEEAGPPSTVHPASQESTKAAKLGFNVQSVVPQVNCDSQPQPADLAQQTSAKRSRSIADLMQLIGNEGIPV
jgi:hypothetical protein